MGRRWEHHQVVVREPTGIDGRDSGARQQPGEAVGQIDLTCEEGWVIRAGQPLAQRDHMLQFNLGRRNREGRIEVQAIRRSWRALICALHTLHRISHISNVVLVSDKNFCARASQPLGSVIVLTNERADGKSSLQQLQGNGKPVFPAALVINIFGCVDISKPRFINQLDG